MEFLQRVGIDCRLAGPRHAGIGRYIQNLVIRLPKLAPSLHWILFFHDDAQAREVLQDLYQKENIKIVLAPIRHYSVREQTKLASIFGKEKLDLLHVPHFNIPLRYKGKIALTIHDLLWHEHQGAEMTTLPGWQYQIKHLMYRYIVKQAVKRATVIFVPAETVRQTVSTYYPNAAEKIVVTKEGVDDAYQITNPQMLPRDKTLIYVGSLYPHKNIQLVIEALEKLPGYNLALAGTRNIFQEEVRTFVKKKNMTDRVHFLGFVRDKELAQMYQTAFALVQPSLSEGFGLTGVEGMAAGIPVLASQIPIFTEIYQDAALYFDPLSVESFCSAVHVLEQADQKSIIARGQEVAQQYSWDRMATETLKKIQKLM